LKPVGLGIQTSKHSHPASFIPFHHLCPTKIRQLTFLTTKKSRAARTNVTTKIMTKLSKNRAERMYITRPAAC